MANSSDVTKCMHFLFTLIDGYTIDKDGYVIDAITNEHAKLRKKSIMVIGDKISDPNAVVLNPFNESLKQDVTVRWMYANILTSFILRTTKIYTVIDDIISDGDVADISPNLRKRFSGMIKDFDKKTYKHFTAMASDLLVFMNIVYTKKTRTSTFRCALFEAGNPLLTKVRKKSIKVLTDIMATVLDVKSEEEAIAKYHAKSRSLITPHLESFLTVLLNLYDNVNQTLEDIGADSEYSVDLTEFAYHVKNLEEYYKKTKWFNGTIAPKEEAAVTNVINNNPNQPSTTKAWLHTPVTGGSSGFIRNTGMGGPTATKFMNAQPFGNSGFNVANCQPMETRLQQGGFIHNR